MSVPEIDVDEAARRRQAGTPVVDDFLGDLAFAAAHHGESRGVAASYGGVV